MKVGPAMRLGYNGFGLRKTGRAEAGFSLPEMLVSVTIIAVLAAILVPVLVRAKGRAVQTACLSNEMQVSKAIQLYAGDYDGLFNFGHDYSVDDWYGPIAGYTGGTLAACPAFHPEPDEEWPKFGYSMNGCLESSPTDISEPSLTVLLTETTSNHLKSGAGGLIVSYAYMLDKYEYERPAIAAIYDADLPYGAERHGGGSNFALVDGHAAWRRPSSIREQDPPMGCEDSPSTKWQGPADGLRFVP